MDIQKYLKERKELEQFVDNCQFKNREEVARLFREYTELIWDKKMVGKIYDYYVDDIVINREGGKRITGVDNVVSGTLNTIYQFPNIEFKFVDIFAEGNEEDGYKFGQALYYKGQNLGYSEFGEPTGKEISPENSKCFALCECLVKKIDGRWKIVEEWLVRSNSAMEETRTLKEGE